MPKAVSRFMVRSLAAACGVGLLAYLIYRIGPATLLKQVAAVGAGIWVVLLLAGFSHLVKTWAWRLTLPRHARCVSLPRAFGLRLISEAIAQLGVAGQVLGEGTRVSLLRASVPVDVAVCSAALDRGLFTLSAALVSAIGVSAALVLLPLSHCWKIYAAAFAIGMAGFVVFAIVAALRRWSFMGGIVSGLGKIPWLTRWSNDKQRTIESAEQMLFDFRHREPAAFWGTIGLNFVTHGLAIGEVCLLLFFLRGDISPVLSLIFEGFTKLVNTVGALVPGNVGTYEGGTMLIGKLFGISAAMGLTIGFCRRARGLFWAAIGVFCLAVMSRSVQNGNSHPGIPANALGGAQPPLETTV